MQTASPRHTSRRRLLQRPKRHARHRWHPALHGACKRFDSNMKAPGNLRLPSNFARYAGFSITPSTSRPVRSFQPFVARRRCQGATSRHDIFDDPARGADINRYFAPRLFSHHFSRLSSKERVCCRRFRRCNYYIFSIFSFSCEARSLLQPGRSKSANADIHP